MAMQKNVIVTEKGLEGIKAESGSEILVADTAQDFVRCVDLILAGAFQGMGSLARHRVQEDFNWRNTLPVIGRYLDKVAEPLTS